MDIIIIYSQCKGNRSVYQDPYSSVIVFLLFCYLNNLISFLVSSINSVWFPLIASATDDCAIMVRRCFRVEKYRPQTLDDLISHKDILTTSKSKNKAVIFGETPKQNRCVLYCVNASTISLPLTWQKNWCEQDCFVWRIISAMRHCSQNNTQFISCTEFAVWET